MGKPYPQIIIHVIGNRGVGKHSLTTMFTKGWLPDKKEDESMFNFQNLFQSYLQFFVVKTSLKK